LSEALLFGELKKEIDQMIAEYGAEQAPPPWQIFTIPNNIQEGNLHFVQKVFEGAFEVITPQLHQTKRFSNVFH